MREKVRVEKEEVLGKKKKTLPFALLVLEFFVEFFVEK
jgi:hypothetical protein